MPRFFFHLRKRDGEVTDPEGMELTNAAVAREQATRTVRDFFQPFLGRVDPEWKGWSLAVCDERHHCVFAMDFAVAAALRQDDHIVDDHIVLAIQPSRRIVYLELERMRRTLSTLMSRTQDLFEHKTMLLDQSRYEGHKLRQQLRASALVRQRAKELLARSRQQSEANPLWGNAAWSAGYSG